VGGIAAGKSTVASRFAAHGIRHVDADFHAREVSEAPAVVEEVAQEIGDRFVQDGKLDRQALSDHVFRDPAAKAKLEQIVHPRVRQRILSELDEASSQGLTALLDVPLLFEAGLVERCDLVVFVHASDSTRQSRAQSRGWANDELARRESNQMPLTEKRARSQHVIDNDGDLERTHQAVDDLLAELGAGA